MDVAENIPIEAENIFALKEFALKNKIDLTVVGPEVPLSNGIVNEFNFAGLKCFGPSKEAALIESSKSFTRGLLKKYNIPSAEYAVCSDAQDAISYVKKNGVPSVVKADGLAAGKGVVVAETEKQAIDAINSMLVEKAFGESSSKILLEEKLEGEEASILAFCDGKNVVPMVSSQDHKRVFDKDLGSNTGGMGAYSPAPIVSETLMKKIIEKILKPTVKAMALEGRTYKGVLYAGLMIDAEKVSVLEFNARFGDPETQVVLPRLDSDLVPIMFACIEGKLNDVEIEWKKDAACCVVMASGGYPNAYEKGKKISGLNEVKKLKNAMVFHAGTKKIGEDIVSNGGRVLNVVGLGPTIKDSIDTAYNAVSKISFEKMHYRKDIGYRALRKIKKG